MIGTLITLIIYLVVLGILAWLALWVAGEIPIPEPLYKIIRIAVIVIVALVFVLLLLQSVGSIDAGLPRIGP